MVLASNAQCAVQAFRVGRTAYGVQYHVEIGEDTVEDWEAIPAYAASLERALGKEGVDQLAIDTTARLPAVRERGAPLQRQFPERDRRLEVIAS